MLELGLESVLGRVLPVDMRRGYVGMTVYTESMVTIRSPFCGYNTI